MNSGEYTARSQTSVKRARHGSAANSASVGWPGTSARNRGMISVSKVGSSPGSAA